MTIDVSESYKKLDEITHVLTRPGMYIGSVTNKTERVWVLNNMKMQEQELTFSPGLLKMVDEIISNSVDEHIRQGKIKNIWVETFPMTGEIVIKDDGGIPVILHTEYKTYIPEMIFSEFRTGSNFDDSERNGAGMNGLGAKLTSVFSLSFKVDTADGKKRFVQSFKNNLSERGKSVIQPCTDNYTKISFTPDYKRFDCDLDDDNLKKIEKRLYDVAGCNHKLKVHYNGKQIKINGFDDYVKLFSESAIIDSTDTFEVAVAPSVDDTFRQVSFVNGIDTFNGGTHVEYVSNQICTRVREFIKKKHKIDVKPNIIKQQMFLFIRCQIKAPAFTSQTKEFMNSEIKNFGTSYTPSEKFIKKLMESEVVQKVLDWVEGEKRREELAELRKLNKTTQNTNFLKRIEKFDDATSNDRMKCTVFFTEGDSAAKTILSARNSALHGVMPLRGKPLNVRDVEVKKLASNAEFQNIMAIIGLKIGQKVTKPQDLRFGKICILADNDPDGQHITGLLINMFNEFWPELLTMGLLHRMVTPLILAEKSKKRFEFFDEKSYNEWVLKNGNHKSKYFKGLGGFMTKDFKEFLNDPSKYLLRIIVEDSTDIEMLNVAFDKSKADLRKNWLMVN